MDGNDDKCETVGEDGAGVHADFILYVSAIGIPICPHTQGFESQMTGFESQMIAFSSHCQLEEEYDRYNTCYCLFIYFTYWLFVPLYQIPTESL